MKKTLALLAASTALTVAIALPVSSAMRPPADSAAAQPDAADPEAGRGAPPLVLASDDDDDDRRRRPSRAEDDDDDHDDDGDDDGDDDDDDEDRRGTRLPAPAGTVAPPQNGLFGNGAPPQVRVN